MAGRYVMQRQARLGQQAADAPAPAPEDNPMQWGRSRRLAEKMTSPGARVPPPVAPVESPRPFAGPPTPGPETRKWLQQGRTRQRMAAGPRPRPMMREAAEEVTQEAVQRPLRPRTPRFTSEY